MNGTHTTLYRIGSLALICLLACGGNAFATQEQSTVRAVAAFENARANDGRHDLNDAGIIVATARTSADNANKSVGVRAESASCCSHYVYSGFTELFDDLDYDGFHTYLRVNVDIDTDYPESDLWVEVYLRGSTGGWVRIFESDVFTIHGTSAFDDYEVESELVSGFVPDYYDVLVDVYDAYSGDLVASYGPADDSSFALLPLEDIDRDGPIVLPVVTSYGSGGGGSLSIAALFLLTTMYLVRNKRLHSVRATRNLSRRTMSSKM